MRLYGVNVADLHCRTLIASLIADGSPDALETAELISGGLAGRGAPVVLTAAMRDVILENIAKPPPSGLTTLQKVLMSDQRARR